MSVSDYTKNINRFDRTFKMYNLGVYAFPTPILLKYFDTAGTCLGVITTIVVYNLGACSTTSSIGRTRVQDIIIIIVNYDVLFSFGRVIYSLSLGRRQIFETIYIYIRPRNYRWLARTYRRASCRPTPYIIRCAYKSREGSVSVLY